MCDALRFRQVVHRLKLPTRNCVGQKEKTQSMPAQFRKTAQPKAYVHKLKLIINLAE